MHAFIEGIPKNLLISAMSRIRQCHLRTQTVKDTDPEPTFKRYKVKFTTTGT